MASVRTSRWLLLGLFSASGGAALVYELCWLEQLAGALSKSTHALSVVLAAYLGGLALGARWTAARAVRSRAPVAAYARLEWCVAAAAICVPFILRFVATRAFTPLDAGLAHGVRIALAGLVIGAATCPLGATFPFQIAALRVAFRGAARSSGSVLAVQTLGGAAGVLIAAFVCLPRWGLTKTHTAAWCVTLAVALATTWWARREAAARPATAEPAPAEPATTVPKTRRVSWSLLGLAAVAGGSSLAWQVLFTRVLSFFLPSLAWSFSVVLAVYLVALALGAMLAASAGPRVRTPAAVAAFAVVAAALALHALTWIDDLHGLVRHFQSFSGGYEGVSLFLAASCAALLLVLPSATVLAAVLPLTVGAASRGADDPHSAGRLYAVNSLGSAFGAGAAGWLLVPWCGIQGSVVVVSCAVGGLGLVVAWTQSATVLTRGLASVAAVLALLAAQRADVSRPLILDSAVFQSSLAKSLGRRLVDSREGSVTVASVIDSSRGPSLYTDAFLAAGSGEGYRYMRMLGHLPMLLAEDPSRAVVIAFGTGATAGAVSRHTALDELTLVEISPEVLELAPHFESVNHGLPETAPDGVTLRVVVDDGRAFLRRTRDQFGVITLEPLLPNSPAAVHFYSRDFFTLAASRLAKGGVLCHWIPLHGQEPSAFEAVVSTFASVFDESDVFLYASDQATLGGSVVLLGWNERPAPDVDAWRQRMEAPGVAADLAAAGAPTLARVLAGYVTSGARVRVRGDVPPVTDDHPYILYPTLRPNWAHFGYEVAAFEWLDARRDPSPFDVGDQPEERSAADIARRVRWQLQRARIDALRETEQTYRVRASQEVES